MREFERCGECDYDLRGHSADDACPECGSRSRALAEVPLVPTWLAWGLIVLPVLFLPAIGYVFLGLAFSESRADSYMRVLAFVVYLLFFFTAACAILQLRKSPKHGLWSRYWVTLASGAAPLFLFVAALVLYTLIDMRIVNLDLFAFDYGFVLNLVPILGVVASVFILLVRPYQPRLLISLAMPLHAIAAGLLMWVVVEFYSPFF